MSSSSRPTIQWITRAVGVSGNGARPDGAPVAQDGERVGNLLDLFEEVADVDDRDAARAERFDDVQEPFDVGAA